MASSEKKRVIKTICKVLIFCGGLAGLFILVNVVFTPPKDYRSYQSIKGFYSEEENKLDAVFIGSSVVFVGWEAPVAWHDYGIAVHSFASSSQPFAAARYIIEEAAKTQPNAVYIVYINKEAGKLRKTSVHHLVNHMKLSPTKIRLINSLADSADYSYKKRLEFLFPVFTYHTRWSQLTPEDVGDARDIIKGANDQENFLADVEDLSEEYIYSDRVDEEEEMSDELLELMDYCRKNDIKLLFYAAPQIITNEDKLARINTILDMVEAEGFPVLNLLDEYEQTGLNPGTDYYNERHTNIHGGLKTTDYIARYLVENYGFEDKRGRSDYEDWDVAAEEYYDRIAPYVLEEELDVARYDRALAAPELVSAESDDSGVLLSWEPVAGAEGYHVYRKTKEGARWSLQAEIGDETVCLDSDVEPDRTYIYTVIANRTDAGGNVVHGNYDFSGIKSQAE